MAIRSKGRKPSEWASKSSHSHLINDPIISDYISKCTLPDDAENIDLENGEIHFSNPTSVIQLNTFSQLMEDIKSSK